MKFKLFLSTAILSGVMAVTASAAVSGVAATGRNGDAVTNWTSDTDQKTVLTVNPGDTFSFNVANPGDYVTVITYLEGSEDKLGNDTILYVNQYAAESNDYAANATNFTVSYKVREGLANGVYRLEVNSGSGSTEKVWYKLGRSDLSEKQDGKLYTNYKQFGNVYSAGYYATYKGSDKDGTNLGKLGFEIRRKLEGGSLSEENITREIELNGLSTGGDISYGMTISGASSLDDFEYVVVTPYAEYTNTPVGSGSSTDAQ